jgi:hypothetical protein
LLDPTAPLDTASCVKQPPIAFVTPTS